MSSTQMVIVDSSTLIHLSAIRQLTLLKDLYGRLTVTPAVWHEVVYQAEGRPGGADLEAARRQGWLEVRTPRLGCGALHGLPRGRHENRAQHLVAAEQLVESPAQRRDLQPFRKPHQRRDVVGRVLRLQQVEEPQPLLCGGEQRIGASAAGNEPRLGRPGALSHGTGLCAGVVFNHAQSRFLYRWAACLSFLKRVTYRRQGP
jgi:hypothetical protein